MLLLLDVFENFHEKFIEIYKLDRNKIRISTMLKKVEKRIKCEICHAI